MILIDTFSVFFTPFSTSSPFFTVTSTASAPPPMCADRGVIAIASGGELGSYSARLGEFGPKVAEEFAEKARRTRVTSGRGDGGVRQRAV